MANAPEIVIMEVERSGKTVGVRYRKADVPKGAKTISIAQYKKNAKARQEAEAKAQGND